MGLVASHARPGGNLTGLDGENKALIPKRVQLLKETIPRIRRVALLVDPTGPARRLFVAEVQAAAPRLGVQLQTVEADVNRLADAFATMTANGAEAVVFMTSTSYAYERKRIVELAATHRLHSVFDNREYVADGGLMSYEGAPSAVKYRL